MEERGHKSGGEARRDVGRRYVKGRRPEGGPPVQQGRSRADSRAMGRQGRASRGREGDEAWELPEWRRGHRFPQTVKV